MNIWGRFFGFLLLFGAGFLFGYQVAPTNTSGSFVTVTLVNASGKGIRTLHLVHDHGTIDISDMPDGTSKAVYFYSPKETSYKIEVNFNDDNFLESGKRYVASGQKPVETIKELEIAPDFANKK